MAAIATSGVAGALAWELTVVAMSYPYFLEIQSGVSLTATAMLLMDVVWLFVLLPGMLLAAMLMWLDLDGGPLVGALAISIWYLVALAAMSLANTDVVPWHGSYVLIAWLKRLPMAVTVGAVFGATFRGLVRRAMARAPDMEMST